ELHHFRHELTAPFLYATGLLIGHLLPRVTAEQTRWRKLAKLMTNHVLRDVHRNELVPVVDSKSMTDKLGENGARPRPRLRQLLFVPFVHTIHLGFQAIGDKRTLLNAS